MVFYVLAMSCEHVIKKLQLKAEADKRQVVFSKNSLLLIHNRIHNEEKPDKFKDVARTLVKEPVNVRREFTLERNLANVMSWARSLLRGNLTRHRQIIHVGEKVYKCNEYGKLLSRKINLKIHNRIHTGGKLYQCNECGKVFWHKATFSFHQHTHARDLTNIMSVARTLVKKKVLQLIIKEVILGRNLTNVMSVARFSIERITFQFIIEFILERNLTNVMIVAIFFSISTALQAI